jgi:hypothetical protein
MLKNLLQQPTLIDPEYRDGVNYTKLVEAIRDAKIPLTEASYIIFKDADGYYKAKNGLTGAIDFSGADAATVIQQAINSLTTGKIFLKNGTYNLATSLVVKKNIVIEGESELGTLLNYAGSDVAVKGTDLDYFVLKNLAIYISSSALGCLLIGEGTTFAKISNVRFVGADKTVAGQYGVRFDARNSWCYYNWVVNCLFYGLNKGIVTLSSGTARANAQLIINPQFYNIGAVGIDFSPDGSGEHIVLGGWWAYSANAIGFKSNGYQNYFIGCQLEMGSGAKSYELGSGSSRNVLIINDNNPISSVNSGSNNFILSNAFLNVQGDSVFDNIYPKSTIMITFGTTKEVTDEAMLRSFATVVETHPNVLAFGTDRVYATAPTAAVHEASIILGRLDLKYPILRVGWLGTVEAKVYYDYANWAARCYLETSPDGVTWTTQASTPTSGYGTVILTWTPTAVLTNNLYLRIRLRQGSGIANTYSMAALFYLKITKYPLNSLLIFPVGVNSNSGTATFSGDGTTKVFAVSSHGLAVNPTDRTRIKAYATPQSADAENASPVSAYPADLNGDGAYEGLKIVFATPPAAGTNNVVVKWYAELD